MKPSLLLIVSLVLNAFFVGYLGIRFHRHGWEHQGWPDVHAFESRLLSRLSSADAGIVRAEFDKENATLTEYMKKTVVSRERIRKVLSAEPFLPEQLADAFRAHRLAVADTLAAVQEILVRVAKDISTEGRVKMFANHKGERP